MVTKLSSESSEQDNCDKFTKTETSENHTSHDVKLISLTRKLVRCRSRFIKRKTQRKLLNCSIFSNNGDERPLLLDTTFYGLLDSGASVSVLGKDSLSFIESNHLTIKPFKSKISTANGSNAPVLGICKLNISYKDVSREIDFYIVPSMN